MSTNVEESKISFSYLRKFNMVMGVLHLVQALIIFGLSLVVDEIKNFQIDIYRSYLGIK